MIEKMASSNEKKLSFHLNINLDVKNRANDQAIFEKINRVN
jgi:hypothetical protein